MVKLKNKRFLALTLSLLFVLAGCGGTSDNSSTDEVSSVIEKTTDSKKGDASNEESEKSDIVADDDTLTIAIENEVNNIDIIHAYSHSVNIILNGIAEGLFYYDSESQIQSRLVESYDQPDDKTYIYHIKSGVTFSTGDHVTADDVVFSLERQKNPENGGELSWMFENVESIEKTGDLEVTVKLVEPDVTWQDSLATTASLVVSKKYFEEHSDNFGTPDGGIVGSGPYKIEKWVPGEEIILVENENYWDTSKEVDFKKVVFEFITDTSVAKLALLQGEVDYVGSLTPDEANELESEDGISVQTPYPYSEHYLSFNCSREPFNDVNFRKAVSYAIDKKSIVDSLFYGKYAEVGTGLLYGPSTVTVETDLWKDYFETVEKYERNLETAEDYLSKSEAGKSGKDISVVLKYSANNTTDEAVAIIVQQNLSDIGINVTLEAVSLSEVSILRYGGTETRDYDLLLTTWWSDYPDPVGVISPMFISTNNIPGGSNWFEYKNEEFDKLILDSNHESDTKIRAKELQDASTILADEQPAVALYYYDYLVALSDRVDYEISPLLLYNQYLGDFKKAK